MLPIWCRRYWITAPIRYILLGRDPEVLKQYTKLPYPRISYKKAIEMLQAAGMDVKYGDDFGSPEETYLSDQFDQPVFVSNYPKAIKPFYMLTDRKMSSNMSAPIC